MRSNTLDRLIIQAASSFHVGRVKHMRSSIVRYDSVDDTLRLAGYH